MILFENYNYLFISCILILYKWYIFNKTESDHDETIVYLLPIVSFNPIISYCGFESTVGLRWYYVRII